MSQAAPAVAQAAPAADTNTQQAAPTSGASSFQDYVASLPDDLKTHVANKGFKDWADPIKAHASAEKLIGNRVELPKEGDEAARDAFFAKLGWPGAEGKYDLKFAEGQTIDQPFLETAQGWLRDARVAPWQAQILADRWNAAGQAAQKAQADADAAADAKLAEAKKADMTALQTQYGEKFAPLIANAKKAWSHMGWTQEQADAVESVIGTKTFIEGFAKIGAAFGTEDQFVDGHGLGGPRNTKKSPAERLYPNLPS